MIKVPLPSYDRVLEKAENSDFIALTVPLSFDHETAVSLADRFVDQKYFTLLESASYGPHSRYSFLAFDPLWVFRYDAAHSTVTIDDGVGLKRSAQWVHPNPVLALKQMMGGKVLQTVYPDGTRLGGADVVASTGVFGYFAYDIASRLEPSVGQMPEKLIGLPDAWFFLPQSLLVFDHLARRLFVSRIFRCKPEPGHQQAPGERQHNLADLYNQAMGELSHLIRKLQAFHGPPALEVEDEPLDFQRFESLVSESEFKERVEHCLEAIRRGDIFQIQIGNRLSGETQARPFDIFRHLRMINPSPYMFFCRFEDHHLIGASPEMMLQVDGKRLTHRPIAGTRRRSWNPEKDYEAKQELIESEKERAEHIMLVDLARNDIGRLAVAGTVVVEELMKIEEYSHVFHLVSQVSGILPEDKDCFDALIVSFPNGTVTGAPKIKAMELINRYERFSREFYAGCLGVVGFNGDMRTTLLIRTIHCAQDWASTQASAGIVYDSSPDHEWLEIKNKVTACLLAIQNTL
jgi:anthranilate synthase component 1